jgi:hypothetical protein
VLTVSDEDEEINEIIGEPPPPPPPPGNYHYISTTGSDVTGDGTIDNPWKTLRYACTQVTTSGHIVYVNAGNYTETLQSLLSSGVTILGAGRGITNIKSSYAVNYEALIKLETDEGWGVPGCGNQSISGITFDGDLVTYGGIFVNFRHNVLIYNCSFVKFLKRAVQFLGQPEYDFTLDNPYNENPGSDYTTFPDPDGWCSGNQFYNNMVTNCATVLNGSSSKGVTLDTQDGALVYGNTIDNSARKGFGIGFWNLGYNKNCKIHDNSIKAAPAVGCYEFCIEFWWSLGGNEIYANAIDGAIDIVHSVDHISAGYSTKIYNNDIGRATPNNVCESGILIEGRVEYLQAYRNKIHHVARAMLIPRHNYTWVDRLFHVDIYDNLMVKLGQNATDYQTWGIYWPDYIDENEHQYVKIQNNTIEADPTLSTVSRWGMQLPNVNEQSYIYVENNIILNFDSACISATGTRTKADHIYIRNNLFYNNGGGNDPVYDANFIASLTNYTYSGTVKADPLFISSSNYHLQSGSSAKWSGLNVGIAKDYDLVNFHDPPSRGCYEYI